MHEHPKPSDEILLHQIQVLSIQPLFNETIAKLEVELSRPGNLIVADVEGKLCMIMEIPRVFDQTNKEPLDDVYLVLEVSSKTEFLTFPRGK